MVSIIITIKKLVLCAFWRALVTFDCPDFYFSSFAHGDPSLIIAKNIVFVYYQDGMFEIEKFNFGNFIRDFN